ncbi:hypothetical protein KNO81_42340 [Paraburkholderia sediminicola]|nr:hypothetical protein [Paraburkholderia sediminicola]
MAVQLTEELRTNLSWLVSTWKSKQLASVSSFNGEFYSALLALLDGSASDNAIHLVIEGTRGKAADGYARLLDVEPDAVAKEPFVALRRLGDISMGLTAIGGLPS